MLRSWPSHVAGLCIVVACVCLPGRAGATWGTDGDRIVGDASLPAAPVMLPSTASTFLAAWVDGRSGYNTDVRVTRWDASGAPVAGWSATGNALTNITCRKYALTGIADGAGGAIYAWSDDRCVGTRRIYACRVNAAGARAASWPVDGLRIAPTSTDQFSPAIVADGSGGAFIAWQDHRNADADLYLQRVDANGSVASGWPSAGVVVASVAGVQSLPQVASDGAGGVFVAWIDRRAGNDDVYLQRVTGTSAVAGGWVANGKAICSASGDQAELGVVADGAGGVFLAWRDPRSGDADVYALRVTASGATATGWTAGGDAVAVAAGEQSGVRIAGDGALGLMLTWQDHRGADWDVWAQRLGPGGSPASGWSAGGVAIAAGAGDQLAPSLDADGTGGAYVAWQSGAAGASDIDALRVSAGGAPAAGWSAGGARLCSVAGDQLAPSVRTVGSDAFLLWTDLRDGVSSPSLYAHRVTSIGPLVTRPSALAALHHDGQTFLTWTTPPDTGWTYRVYQRGSPIASEADLAGATLLGSVGDSSSVDRRLSSITGSLFTFRPDSAAAFLSPQQGLFVVTMPANRQSWYAVTAQPRAGAEDRRITPGVNALAGAVSEVVAMPRPVFQRTRTCGAVTQHVYTLWTWSAETPLMPQMSNRPSQPFDCGVTKGTPGAPGFVRPHPRAGNFAQQCQASGALSEWVLALDDYTTNQDVCTYYYGYHPGYDVTSDVNSPPTTGQVVDYTNRRMLHTIDWWRRSFALDTTRTYAFGYSLGGTYSLQLGLAHPERIVAAMSVVGKVDFSYESEPDTNSMFNAGKPFRQAISRLWGTTTTNLPTTDDAPVYSMVNDGALATMSAAEGSAFLVNFAGRNDVVVGWAEKLPFYAALASNRHGGMQFWDNRDHTGLVIPGAFSPMLDLTYLYRFQSDLSWPAFSHCSADGNPGNGWAASGDTLGTINGAMDWDPAVTDSATSWGVTLRTRSLSTRWGVLPAPDSVTVDVTPRRLQRFRPSPGVQVAWTAVRVADGATIQSGVVSVDALGRVTIPAVKTHRTGTRLSLGATSSWLDVGPGRGRGDAIVFSALTNPLRSRSLLALHWPERGRARVELFDTLGRRARRLFDGIVPAGAWSLPLDVADLPPGIYQLRASQGDRATVRRVARLR